MMTDTNFPPSLLDAIRAKLPVSLVVGRTVELQPCGRELRGLSPSRLGSQPAEEGAAAVTKLICDACGKRIKADTAAVTVNTTTTTDRYHTACFQESSEPPKGPKP